MIDLDVFRTEVDSAIASVEYNPDDRDTNVRIVEDIRRCDRVFAAMEQVDMPLLLHGEVTDG